MTVARDGFAGYLRPTWVLAHRQTGGHGRRGRPWANPRGAFTATLALPRPGTAQAAAQRSFVAALALFDAVVAVTGRPDGLSLKWPNDVLLNGGKLAGILLESLGPRRDGTLDGLLIGIGVNLIEPPVAGEVEEGAVRPVALAEETGVQVTPEEFLDALAPAYARHEQAFTAQGFGPIRRAWLDRAARLGQTITARLPGEAVTGTFKTIDEMGYLQLQTDTGLRGIAAAEVFF
ncbi:BirA family transcriptional regulator, biotin operon repressor / biotin-[acetyl-CoA-carboxylase] ligase [Vannielia litorea]|uniref:biotin--[biotin carboxyl-carrier protein] ligase n=2 Tax=Vannielia litorea TaxID=1217970 RepID=A0A1N6F0Q9_9RHOB|nr:BirA family transcriptional regulator, biotin operon repressor / biotin-[acetyl-CoA-carboxylase] ligase [Vannielia litorea]